MRSFCNNVSRVITVSANFNIVSVIVNKIIISGTAAEETSHLVFIYHRVHEILDIIITYTLLYITIFAYFDIFCLGMFFFVFKYE